jgi:transposase
VTVRWVFTAEEKRAILDEYALAPYGTKGAVLRRHRISRHQLARWATYRDRGALEIGSREWKSRMTPRVENAEIVRLRAEVRRLEAERDQAVRDRAVAEAAVEVLGKASALLQQALQSAEPSPPSDPCSPPASSS